MVSAMLLFRVLALRSAEDFDALIEDLVLLIHHFTPAVQA